MADLFHIDYSPWSEKARWALAHHQIPYNSIEPFPMVGTAKARARTHRWTEKITFPLMITDEERVLTDSLAIARWSDLVGQATPLFPATHTEEILHWNEISERALAAGRALTTAAIKRDPDALLENVPKVIPRRLGPAIGQLGAMYLARKYRFADVDLDRHRETLHSALHQLRDSLPLDAESDVPPYLCAEQFTWADIAMAMALQFVAPVADHYVPLGPYSRERWRRPGLDDEFADLIAWRDALYDTHRNQPR